MDIFLYTCEKCQKEFTDLEGIQKGPAYYCPDPDCGGKGKCVGFSLNGPKMCSPFNKHN